MRIHVGTFDEDTAEKVAEDLRKAGIKVELRHFIDLDMEGSYYIEGKLSELKEKFGEIFSGGLKKIEEHFSKARKIFQDGMKTKEFEEKFLDEIMPERKKFDEIRKIMKEKIKEQGKKKIEDIFDEIAKEVGKERMDEYMHHFVDEMHYMNFFHSLLEKNGIKYEGDVMRGEIAEDPFIKLYVEASDEEAEKYKLEYEYRAFVNKKADVYASLIDIIFEVRRLEELVNKKRGYAHLLFMADLMMRFLDSIEGKKDIDAFIEDMRGIEEEDGKIFVSRGAINEILKALEKAELIKVKKGKIIRK